MREEYGLGGGERESEREMDEFPGALGTSASLALRFGQVIFSLGALLFMCLDAQFYGYTPFCLLVTTMGLVFPWSLTLAVVDGFSVFVKRPIRQRVIMWIIVIGDWILSLVSLGAACSTASVTDLLISSGGPFCNAKSCSRYQMSAAMTCLTWFLTSASSFFNLWLLPSL